MSAGDYVQRLIGRDRRRGTTLWAIFRTEDYLVAITADAVLLIAEYVVGHMNRGAMPPDVLIYNVTFDATCPDDVLAAVLMVPRDRFLPHEERRSLLRDTTLWRILRHPHGVKFRPRRAAR
jgi:hypothetical protein